MEKKMGFFEKLKKSLSKAGDGMLSAIFTGGDRVNREFYEELEEAMERMSEGDIEGLFDLGISVRKAEPGFRDHLPKDQRYGFQPYREGEEDE